jgi:hypothetical protein
MWDGDSLDRSLGCDALQMLAVSDFFFFLFFFFSEVWSGGV